jgi:predicted hotdog family 3-hydroxylacyl-ACP dehydratase
MTTPWPHPCTLIPHAGSMCLLDAIDACTEDHIACSTQSHCLPAHPLQRDGQLAAIHLIEYAAQAVAAHGALRSAHVNPPQARPGMLAALRDVHFYIDRIDTLTTPLQIEATCKLARNDGLVYDFTVRAAAQVLCTGRVVIALT